MFTIPEAVLELFQGFIYWVSWESELTTTVVTRAVLYPSTKTVFIFTTWFLNCIDSSLSSWQLIYWVDDCIRLTIPYLFFTKGFLSCLNDSFIELIFHSDCVYLSTHREGGAWRFESSRRLALECELPLGPNIRGSVILQFHFCLALTLVVTSGVFLAIYWLC